MELRQFRYIIAVAEEGNITRAAERLDMQPPPLSRQIRSIEREIGAQLFHRKARGVELTDAGRAFLDNARAIIAQVDRLFETTRRTARGEQGRICVGYSSSVAFHPLVPRIIREFRRTFQLVNVTLVEGYPDDLIGRMRNDQIDISFVRRLAPGLEGTEVALLLEEPMVVALPSGHNLAQGRAGKHGALSLKALAAETFILFGDPHADPHGALNMQTNAFVAACLAAGFRPRIGQIVPHISSRLNLIAAGLGIAVVAASLEHIKIEGICFRRLQGSKQLTAPLSLASRRGDPSPAVRQFLKSAKQTAETFSLGHQVASWSNRYAGIGSKRKL
jgi:DNA-binding transcriptional LysR family regulator